MIASSTHSDAPVVHIAYIPQFSIKVPWRFSVPVARMQMSVCEMVPSMMASVPVPLTLTGASEIVIEASDATPLSTTEIGPPEYKVEIICTLPPSAAEIPPDAVPPIHASLTKSCPSTEIPASGASDNSTSGIISNVWPDETSKSPPKCHGEKTASRRTESEVKPAEMVEIITSISALLVGIHD